MTEATSGMLDRLRAFLEASPGDSFARYGYAMELSKLGRQDEALENYRRVMREDPDYVAAYQQAAMLLVRMGQAEKAKDAFRGGIDAARRKGDSRALHELQGMLSELGPGE